MLSWLALRDYAIVRRLELSFDAGVTVLTGETGAGKSVLADALGLLLGGRADTAAIRPGATETEIQAAFDITAGSDAGRWLTEQDLADENACLLRRVIPRDKPSRGFINGRAVPAQMMRALGEHLVDLHGQHEHQSLLRADAQRRLLDEYAGISDEVRALGDCARRLNVLVAERESASTDADERVRQIGLLQHGLDEIDAFAPGPGELDRLEADCRRLDHLQELVEGGGEVLHALYDADERSVYDELHRALDRIRTLGRFDPALSDIAILIEDALVRVTEASDELRRHSDRYDADPNSLEALQQRIATWQSLARKHQVSPEELPAVRGTLASQLAALESAGEQVDRLDQEIATCAARYDTLADRVSEARARIAPVFSGRVTAEMRDLGMPGGVFEIVLARASSGRRPAAGTESVEFHVSTNPGYSPGSLTRIASGGELSRISLAVQVVAAGAGTVPTLVFDEVDVGVGGRTADVVGRKLKNLGRTRQILCITHLPQVASLGDTHLLVRKLGGPEIEVMVDTLSADGRINEIARMLGSRVTRRSLDHAREMLAGAS